LISVKVERIKPLLEKNKVRVKLLKPLYTKCPICGSELYYLTALGSYYCFNCKKYVY